MPLALEIVKMEELTLDFCFHFKLIWPEFPAC